MWAPTAGVIRTCSNLAMEEWINVNKCKLTLVDSDVWQLLDESSPLDVVWDDGLLTASMN